MHSAEIQAKVYEWAQTRNFTAPYGILKGDGKSKSQRPYKSVTFGRARTLDCSVEIFNQGFIIVDTNRHGRQVMKSVDELMAFLETL